jgi:hypothetical protein
MSWLDHFPNPYASLARWRDMSQLSANVAIADLKLIKSVCPQHGLTVRMIQVFVAGIAQELRERNITHYTPENAQQLIAIVATRSRGCPTTQPLRQGLQFDVARRAERLRGESAGCRDQHTSTEETHRGEPCTEEGPGTNGSSQSSDG